VTLSRQFLFTVVASRNDEAATTVYFVHPRPCQPTSWSTASRDTSLAYWRGEGFQELLKVEQGGVLFVVGTSGDDGGIPAA
jgi:hypothetical protein